MKQFIKRLFFGTGTQPRKIMFGLASSIKMNIDIDNKSQRYLGLDEREIQRSFKKFSAASAVFVDVGASDGYYGLIYYKLRKDGTQYLFDANSSFAEQQRSHFQINDFRADKINFISKFVSNITDDNHIALNDFIKDPAATVFVKIDVDGGELDVLKGLENVLKRNNCKLIVETHSKELEDACIAYLQQFNYSTTIIPNAWWRLFVPELRPIPHNRWFRAEKK
jgi:hypothetical protein